MLARSGKYNKQNGPLISFSYNTYYFSSEAYEEQEMTTVTEENRETMMDTIEDLYTEGLTCLGAAVKAGIKVTNTTHNEEISKQLFLT